MVGCGQIADAHLQEIQKISFAKVVAVCDQQPDLAEQAALWFGIKEQYTDLGTLLSEMRPDVVHLTTPPQTHVFLAQQAMEAGCHVYIEKPFAIDAARADEILHFAAARGRLVCVGHDQLFDPVWIECRKLIAEGELGTVVHVESIQGYDFEGPFGRAFTTNSDHWVHGLPGGVFQNVISHAMYRITDLIPDETMQVTANWWSNSSEGAAPTELRAMLRGRNASAQLSFFGSARPVQRVTRIYGTRQSIELDVDAQSIRRMVSARLPGAFGKVDLPFFLMCQGARSTLKNIRRFICSEIHYFEGMRRLFEQFYLAIREGYPAPIAPSEIRRVTALMDSIFQSCRANETVAS